MKANGIKLQQLFIVALLLPIIFYLILPSAHGIMEVMLYIGGLAFYLLTVGLTFMLSKKKIQMEVQR